MAKKDKRAYFQVDVGYLTNPKVASLVDDFPRAMLLHIQCIAYSAQHLTDGIVPVRLAMRFACASQSDLDACLNAGLLHRVDDAHVEVHDYLAHQRSAAAVKGASERGLSAARARHNALGNAERTALGNAVGIAHREKERKKESCANADASDATELDRFDDFWSAYDKKRDRKKAEQKYRIAIGKKGVTPDLLITAASTYVAAQREGGKHPEFTKDPATWLNGECWQNETPGARPAEPDQPARRKVANQCDRYEDHEQHDWEQGSNLFWCRG